MSIIKNNPHFNIPAIYNNKTYYKSIQNVYVIDVYTAQLKLFVLMHCYHHQSRIGAVFRRV